MSLTDVERCRVEVGEPPGYWHWHPCDRPVKTIITTRDGAQRGVCGVHARMHARQSLGSSAFVKETSR